MADSLKFRDSQAQNAWDANKSKIQAAINSGNVGAISSIYLSIANVLAANQEEEKAPGDNPDKAYNSGQNAKDYIAAVTFFEKAKQEAADNYEKQSGRPFIASNENEVPLNDEQIQKVVKTYGKGSKESVQTRTGFDTLFGNDINPDEAERGLQAARFDSFNAVVPGAFKQTTSADGKSFTYTLEGNGKQYTQQERDEVVAQWQSSTGKLWLGGNRTIDQDKVKYDPASGTVAWQDETGKWNNITFGDASEGGVADGEALYRNLLTGHGTLGISGNYSGSAFSTDSKEGKGVDQDKVNSFRGLGSGDYQSYEKQTQEYSALGVDEGKIAGAAGEGSRLNKQLQALTSTGGNLLAGADRTKDDVPIFIGQDAEFKGLFEKYGQKIAEDGTVTDSQWLAVFDSLSADEKKALANNFAASGVSTNGIEGESGLRTAFMSLGKELGQSYYAATKAGIDPTDPTTYFNKILATNPTRGKTQEDLANEEAAAKRLELEKARDSLLQLASRNGINMSTDALANQLDLISSGKKDLDAVMTEYRQQVASRFPAFSDQILSGTDLATVADPYMQEMAEAFEIPQGSISLADSTLQGALAQRGNAKQQLPAWEFREQLRNDPRFLQTDRAYNGFGQMVDGIAQLFGKK